LDGVKDVIAKLKVIANLKYVIASLKDVVANLKDLIASLKDVVANLKDVIASLKDVVANLKDVIASLKDVTDPSLESWVRFPFTRAFSRELEVAPRGRQHRPNCGHLRVPFAPQALEQANRAVRGRRNSLYDVREALWKEEEAFLKLPGAVRASSPCWDA